MDGAEAWADGLTERRPLDESVIGVPLSLPMSTRLSQPAAARPADFVPDWRTYRTCLPQHFLTPHHGTPFFAELNDAYQRARTAHATALLKREARLGY
jgi:hypothetical protein